MVKPQEENSDNSLQTDIHLGSELPRNSKITYAGLVVVVIAFMLFFGLYGFVRKQKISVPADLVPKTSKLDVKKFENEDEFKQYVHNAKNLSYSGGAFGQALEAPMAKSINEMTQDTANLEALSTGTPYRFSDTNVQVAGIDEPDILKTDGKNIYFSGQYSYLGVQPRPMMIEDVSLSLPVSDEKIIGPDYIPPKQTVKIISAFPPTNLKKISSIEGSGEMLLTNGSLIIFSYNSLAGYDVSDSTSPTQKWKLELDEQSNNQIVASRLSNGKLFIISKVFVNEFTPCAIPVFKERLQISCTEIYRPIVGSNADTMMTAMQINPDNGEVEKKVSFLGSNASSIVYMSRDNLFVTYSLTLDMGEFVYNFLTQSAADLVPAEIITKIEKIRSYEISNDAKTAEIGRILENWRSNMSRDDSLKVQNEIQNRMTTYIEQNSRELESTGVVKINLDNFKVDATGKVPGTPLNQFSLDEYEGNLRIATTTGGSFAWGMRNNKSFSDVYVMDKNLEKSGEVLDLGIGERIYSVRFIADSGYVVTFRQTDPFYVLDLSNTKKPLKVGELKIPGFSSYLHPLKDSLILGVGQENGQVKLSVFDVSNPANPVELYKYNLNDGWSEVQNNHHAFLNDPKNQIFFIPGGLGGYVFSYKNNLALEKAFAGYSVRRALYINNYFYVVGDDEITVYDQSDWASVNSIKLNKPS